MAMVVVAPLDEAHRPLPGGVQIGEPLDRKLRPILGSAERAGEGVVIAHPWT